VALRECASAWNVYSGENLVEPCASDAPSDDEESPLQKLDEDSNMEVEEEMWEETNQKKS
jgi:hypothetical protein